MAAEVISLLSSPGGPSPPVAARQLFPSANALPRARTNPPARRLDYDIFDLTDDTPHQTTKKRSFPVSPNPVARSKPDIARNDDFLFLSDDFDITGDLGVGLDHAPKKPRLSHDLKDTGGSSERSVKWSALSWDKADDPAVLQPARLKSWNSAADPIEFTSSLDAGCAVKWTRSRDLENDDPFASSSPTDKGKKSYSKPPGFDDKENDPFRSPLPLPRIRSPKTATAWDPISSSAPETTIRSCHMASASPRVLSRSRSEVIELGDSDDDLREPPQAFSDDEFPEVENMDLSKLKAKPLASKRALGPLKTRPTASKPATKKSPAAKTLDKEERAAMREAEKERKKREKEQAKEQRALEKERAAALAEVNKIRTDKKMSTPEMIVDLPSTISDTTRLQAETLLQDLDIQHETWTSPVDDVVKWRRKIRSRYNEDLGHWEPIPPRIEKENHAMVILPAAKFIKLVLGSEGIDLDAHILKLQRHFENHTLIYLIEGLTAWMRKNRNVRNRQFQSAVRNLSDDTATGPSSSQQAGCRKKSNQPQEYIDEDNIEDALLSLQVIHGALIHHTNAPMETAQWIAVFTQHISTIPYRRQKEQFNDAAAFCMETGQVRTGEDPEGTYVRMLQEIVRVTAPIAYGVAAEFDTVTKLVKGLEDGGSLTLEAVRKSTNKNGTFSDRVIGQAVSRRIHKVFTGRDETSTDI